ncbi:MAG: hypothetical protein WD061_02650 [Candidatus Saccharimonadales bacterium]
MITINLLPDIKKDYINARRQRNKVVGWSIFSGGVALGLIIISLIIITAQWVVVDRTRTNVEELNQELSAKEDVVEVLTVKNQLEVLPELHLQKSKINRLFEYLQSLTPQGVRLSSVSLDMDRYILEVAGNASSIRDFNILVDTYKATVYQLGPSVTLSNQDTEESSDESSDLSDPANAFSDVKSVMSIDAATQSANFRITIEFDPAIFDARYSTVDISTSGIADSEEQPDVIFDDSMENGE